MLADTDPLSSAPEPHSIVSHSMNPNSGLAQPSGTDAILLRSASAQNQGPMTDLSNPERVVSILDPSMSQQALHKSIMEKSYSIAIKHCPRTATSVSIKRSTAASVVLSIGVQGGVLLQALSCFGAIFDVCGFTEHRNADPRREMVQYLSSLNQSMRSFMSEKSKSYDDWLQNLYSVFALSLIFRAAILLLNMNSPRLRKGYEIVMSLFVASSGSFDPVHAILSGSVQSIADKVGAEAVQDLKELCLMLEASRNGTISSVEDVLAELFRSVSHEIAHLTALVD